MRSIRFEHVSKSYDGVSILEDLSLTIPSGTFFALLGPSGSGKTTILRLIAGLELPDEGEIYLGTENITHVSINKRRVNTVFQNYALFPHMNVFENVAYSLRVRGISNEIIEERVHKILRVVHLERYMYRPVTQLSGGQQQRVAIARAIINEPDVLLLDEPLAALDQKLRERLLIELIDLQSVLKTTFVYVTHDPFEALTVADTMGIMNGEGQVEQIGTPKDIYEFPVSSFVAKFVGSTNLLEGTVHQREGKFYFTVPQLGDFEVGSDQEVKLIEGMHAYMSLRPEKIEITKKEKSGFSNKLTGKVEAIVYHGRSTQYNVRLANGKIVQVFEQNDKHFPDEEIDYEQVVNLYWQKENVVILYK